MSWIADLWRNRRMRRDVAEEIESHLRERVDELIESGVPEREACSRARREFGNPTRVTEQAREVWTLEWLHQLGQDLRDSLRTLRRTPAFTAVAILSLALGIGANTAVFSLLDGMLLKTLPVAHAEQLRILMWHRMAGVPFENQVELAWAAALVLVLLVLITNLTGQALSPRRHTIRPPG